MIVEAPAWQPRLQLHCRHDLDGQCQNLAYPSDNGMDVQGILNCGHGSWGPHFREVAFRSHIIALPADFLSYLVADGIKVPECNKAVSVGHSSCKGCAARC